MSSPPPLSRRRRIEQLLTARPSRRDAVRVRELFKQTVCSGSFVRGETTGRVGGIEVHAPSGGWVVLDRARVAEADRTMRPWSRGWRPKLRTVGQGAGPVAPTFDEFDRDVEIRRGPWIVVDRDALQEFLDELDRLSASRWPRSRAARD